MMHFLSRRLPAITALVIGAILAILASGILVRMVEARSLSDVTQVLRLGGYDWARAEVDGLQVRLSGEAPSEALRFRALTTAGTVVDSARVIDDIEVREAAVEPPDFGLEILRTDDDVSLFGLMPADTDREAFLKLVARAVPGATITDLLDFADQPAPETWQVSVTYGLQALFLLERSKITVAPGLVKVAGVAKSLPDKRKLEAALTRDAPDGLELAVEITAPRPAITPFTLRFVMQPGAAPKFDACSADTDEARELILKAAVKAGLEGKADCVLGLGAPSPKWGEAAALSIAALANLGGGTLTLSDADISLIAPEETDQTKFDTVTGNLENALPDGFSLTAVLPEKVIEETGGAPGSGPLEFVAELTANGAVQLRGKVRDARERQVIDGYAKALFGASMVQNGTRLDEAVPEGWSLRALAALQSLAGLAEGSAQVRADSVAIKGVTGNPDAQADIARILGEKLGQGAKFDLAVRYDKKLDPVLGLPTAEECVTDINAALAAKKLTFAPGSADLDADAAETLDKLAGLMKNCADFPMEIGGHTDSQGRETMNQELSQARAEAVLNALIERKVLTGNLTARGYGETQPIADNGTEAGREANRRIEFRLVKADEEAAEGDDAGDGGGDGGGDGAADGAADGQGQ